MATTTLLDLPLELLDHITTFLPTARAVTSLGAANKKLHSFTESDGWQTFGRTRFPSLYPANPSSHKDAVRNLTTLSRAWDRRALLARYIEPHGNIVVYPGHKNVERWKRPKGQTIGFTPHLDCFEESGSTRHERKEVLAFSAGAEFCVRRRDIGRGGGEDVRWKTYRPQGAHEGMDDVTSLHLLQLPLDTVDETDGQTVIAGTANGDLRLLTLPEKEGTSMKTTSFATEGQPVRSSSVLETSGEQTLLAANLGDTRISLYNVDFSKTEIESISSTDILPTNGQGAFRAWSTTFLSSSNLAIGLGLSREPIHIYSVTPSGLHKEPLRKFSLLTESDTKSYYASCVYPIIPMPPSSTNIGGTRAGQVFLSGGYDGVIRLHDLRSSQQWERMYSDPTDDNAIYSLLARGQEKLIAGTSSHSLLKVFDLRLGAKVYSYLDAIEPRDQESHDSREDDWNLFLRPNSATYPGRGGGNNWARRSAKSSIYSLVSPSPDSPYLYAGVENAVVQLAFTSIMDPHPDPVFFRGGSHGGQDGEGVHGFEPKQVLDLAMYAQNDDMRLIKQRSVGETLRPSADMRCMKGLDERWKVITY